MDPLLKSAALAIREEGFDNRILAAERKPEYDSLADPYCPWGLAVVHNVNKAFEAAALLRGKSERDAAAEVNECPRAGALAL